MAKEYRLQHWFVCRFSHVTRYNKTTWFSAARNFRKHKKWKETCNHMFSLYLNKKKRAKIQHTSTWKAKVSQLGVDIKDCQPLARFVFKVDQEEACTHPPICGIQMAAVFRLHVWGKVHRKYLAVACSLKGWWKEFMCPLSSLPCKKNRWGSLHEE